MTFVDSILNLALLFLWIDWRAGRAARQPLSLISLASAARPTERPRSSGWGSMGVLVLILLVRPAFYYSVGSKIIWTPEIDLLAISLPWRSDLLERMYVYSTVSFGLCLGAYYAALLFLSSGRRAGTTSEVVYQFVRLQLGWLERLPWPLKLLLPLVVAGLAWVAFVPLLVELGLMPARPAAAQLWGQALGLGLTPLLVWEWLLIALFALHLANLYVYLGSHPVWSYISATARTFLKPLSFLTFARVDLAPLAGIVLVYSVAEFFVQPGIVRLFQRFSA